MRIARLAVVVATATAVASTATAADGGTKPIGIELVPVSYPVWLLGLKNPTFLSAFRGHGGGARVVVFGFVDATPSHQEGLEKAPVGPLEEEEARRGNETRGLALFLSERIFAETTCEASAAFFSSPGIGPIVEGGDSGIDFLVRHSRDLKPDFVVKGSVAGGAQRDDVVVELWDTKARVRLHTIRATTVASTGSVDALDIAKQIIGQLLSTKRCKRVVPPVTWAAPGKDVIGPYYHMLNSLLAQMWAEVGLIPVSALSPEDDMQVWYAKVRKEMPSSTPARLIKLRGALLSKAYGGTAWKRVQGSLLRELTALTDTKDEIYELSPLIFALLGSSQACVTRKQALASSKDALLTAWLSRIDCEGPAHPNSPAKTSVP
jgi:hypothetical protein